MLSTSYEGAWVREGTQENNTHPFGSSGHDSNRDYEHPDTNPLVNLGFRVLDFYRAFLQSFGGELVLRELKIFARWIVKENSGADVSVMLGQY
jgi:hypothetical protein